MIEPVAVLGEVMGALSLEDERDTACAELHDLVAEAWAAHPHTPVARRSPLTESGAPFELSVKLASSGARSVRYVVDVADRRGDLADNVPAYLEAARRSTGQPEDLLRLLLDRHLHEAPPGTLATVMVGVGWAAGGRRRSTIYLPAQWLDADILDEVLPAPTGLGQSAEVVGYDIEDGTASCWKTYHWFTVDPDRPLSGSLAEPDLPALAREVHDRFASAVPEPLRGRATFRQRRFLSDGVEDRLFLFTRPWGFGHGTAMRELLTTLGRVGIDLTSLRAVTRAGRLLPMHVGLVSVGGAADPSATFYFWPRPAEGQSR